MKTPIYIISWFFCFIVMFGCIGNGRSYFSSKEFCYSQTKQSYFFANKIKFSGAYFQPRKSTMNLNWKKPWGPVSQVDTIFNESYFFTDDGIFFSYSIPKGDSIGFDEKFYDWPVFRKGRYIMKNDTLTLIDMDKYGQFKYYITRTYFLVIDSLRLRLLYFSNDEKIPQQQDFVNFQKSQPERAANLFNFREQHPLPESSKVWMLDHEWFWCDKEEYQLFKNKKRER